MRASADLIVSNGIEKPSPCAIGIMAVVMPTTRPVLSTRGPPELPGFMDVSVWMRSVIFRVPGACSVRPRAQHVPLPPLPNANRHRAPPHPFHFYLYLAYCFHFFLKGNG